MALDPLTPLNDWSTTVALKTADPTSGKAIALTTGTVTAFLATSDSPTATAADPSLTTTAVQTSKAGTWFIGFDASVLTPTLLATQFGTTPPVLIVEQTDGFRVTAALTYAPSRSMTVA